MGGSFSGASLGAGFFGGFGGRDGLSQDAAKLVAFIHQNGDSFAREQAGQADGFEPAASFDQFLQGDINLVNEIRAALAGTGFVVVWRGRNAAADDLTGNVPTHMPTMRVEAGTVASAGKY